MPLVPIAAALALTGAAAAMRCSHVEQRAWERHRARADHAEAEAAAARSAGWAMLGGTAGGLVLGALAAYVACGGAL